MTNAARALAQSELTRLYAAAESGIELRGIERDEARDALARMTVLATEGLHYMAQEHSDALIDSARTGEGWHQCHACSAWGDEDSLRLVTGTLTDGDWFCDDCVTTP